MTPADLAVLRIEPERIENAMRFTAAYAATCERELEDRQETAGEGALSDDARWVVQADAATTLDEAAQWALLLDTSRAMDLGRRAARHYQELGHAYGLYLMAVCADGEVPFEPLFEGVQRLLSSVGSEIPDGEPPSGAVALEHPQQQVYLALAVAGVPTVRQEFGGALAEQMARSKNMVSGVPTGAMGVALRRYWIVARWLLDGEEMGPVSDQLITISNTYADSVESAMSNEHLWRHGASPVAVADLDLVGMTVLALRRFGHEFRLLLRARMESQSALARLLLDLCLEADGR